MLFTEKLNLKRPQPGGVNPLHQDYPYWVGVADDADRVATSMLFLDDASLDNACFRVVPASHTAGVWTTRTDDDQFATNEIDAPRVRRRRVRAARGAGRLVRWCSGRTSFITRPRTPLTPRRALLFSYQPPGAPHMLDTLRQLGAQSEPRSHHESLR